MPSIGQKLKPFTVNGEINILEWDDKAQTNSYLVNIMKLHVKNGIVYNWNKCEIPPMMHFSILNTEIDPVVLRKMRKVYKMSVMQSANNWFLEKKTHLKLQHNSAKN